MVGHSGTHAALHMGVAGKEKGYAFARLNAEAVNTRG